MISRNGRKNAFAGFTLVELAVVMVISGLLLATFLVPLSAQQEIKARSDTELLLGQAREALIGFAVVNRHLPCPDTNPIPDGIENRSASGKCANDEGILPWNTLGIDQTDAWNHYFGYRADTTFSDSVDRFTIDDATGSTGITINGDIGPLISVTSRPVAVVISYGTNGLGATTRTQASPANKLPMPTGLDELENTNTNLVFVSHTPTPAGSSNEFDDILIWISPKVLINRMILAERLP